MSAVVLKKHGKRETETNLLAVDGLSFMLNEGHETFVIEVFEPGGKRSIAIRFKAADVPLPLRHGLAKFLKA